MVISKAQNLNIDDVRSEHGLFPHTIPNWVNSRESTSLNQETFSKIDPHQGTLLCKVTRSTSADIDECVQSAVKAQTVWSKISPVQRGEILFALADLIQEHRLNFSEIIHLETGKSKKLCHLEIDGAIQLGLFMASEGQRLYGKTTTSQSANRLCLTLREPLGVAGLIVAANTPIANIAWKVFPALICGNSVCLKAAEDAPITAWYFAKIAESLDLPMGLLTVMQGLGPEAGMSIIRHPEITMISFTGSSKTGRIIGETAGLFMKKVSLECGGKNPLVIFDDADIDMAIHWVLLSAFSNAGQRCAAASRILIQESIYDRIKETLIEKTNKLSVGIEDTDDFGPVISQQSLEKILLHLNEVPSRGGSFLTGGNRMTDPVHERGYYLNPTLIEGLSQSDPVSLTELFGPVTCLYSFKDFSEAVHLSNNSPYGLTAAVHTKNIDRALAFANEIKAGVVSINGGTYGSEPHLPFGGVKHSGNGTREPGTEALDVYSNLKNIYLNRDPKNT